MSSKYQLSSALYDAVTRFQSSIDLTEIQRNFVDQLNKDLVRAVENRDYTTIERLLRTNYVDVNTKMPSEASLISHAFIYNDLPAVNLLLSREDIIIHEDTKRGIGNRWPHIRLPDQEQPAAEEKRSTTPVMRSATPAPASSVTSTSSEFGNKSSDLLQVVRATFVEARSDATASVTFGRISHGIAAAPGTQSDEASRPITFCNPVGKEDMP